MFLCFFTFVFIMNEFSNKLIDFFNFLRENYGETIIVDTNYTQNFGSQSFAEPQDSLENYSATLSHSIDIFSSENDWFRSKNLEELEQKIKHCTKCSLGKTRTNFVFGSGNPNADIMFIGEAPGADEDLQGLPFVGRAGQLLNKLLKVVGLEREEVYICNILKCRPPNNRKPLPSEIELCKPYLLKQIELVKPKVIVALGATAIEGLLNLKKKMGELRGKIIHFNKIPVIITYHPAALLRNPNWEADFIEDLKLLFKHFPELTKKKGKK